jgi:hypothetical protein
MLPPDGFANNDLIDQKKRRPPMEIQLALQPLLALIAGIAILAIPRLLNYIVAAYLIIAGVVGLFNL